MTTAPLHLDEPAATSWLSYQERFSQIASEHPQALALIDGARVSTYAQLDRESDLLSLYLQRCGLSPDDLVIIYMPSSYDYVVSCLGVLKAGAAFLPIPVDLPVSQLELIIEDARPKVALSSEAYAEQIRALLSAYRGQTLSLAEDVYESLAAMGPRSDELKPVVPTGPERLAFATYTSGTTGKPKGVLQVQGALVRSYDARHRFNPYGASERVACNVFFMWEILRPLLVGGATLVIPDALMSAPKKLLTFLKQSEATEVLFTPSAFQRLIRSSSPSELAAGLSTLRTIWLNGEVVTSKLVAEALELLPASIKLLNTYSICECHDVSNANLRQLDLEELHDSGEGICPVGRADEGVIIRVKTEEGLEPEGEGELYIGGHGLGAGYLHREELTRERFPELEGQRFYATGDRAALSPTGLITIKGRLGTMVKMRGYSVYLNSIEEELRRHPQISEARVFLRGAHLSQHLTAFLVGLSSSLADWIDERAQSAPRLRSWLSESLPTYMIPTRWVRVDHLPVHPISGKLDQEALWSLERAEELSLEALKLEPQESHEERLELMRRLWARALELSVEQLNEESDFYELGGHSLSMVDLVMSVEELFSLRLEGDELYEHPKLGDFYARLFSESAAHEPRQSDWSPSKHSLDFELSGSEIEAQLKALRAGGPARRVTLKTASCVLLTGATGHLGLGLVEGLLKRLSAGAQLICLVRPTGDRSGEERLLTRFKRAALGTLSDALELGRLQVVEGDICAPRLGLSSERYEELSERVELIFHSAALVNLRARYEQTRPSIVEGSRRLIDFASSARLKTLHHISTNSVQSARSEALLRECSAAESGGEGLSDGYSQAKWVAERLMEEAAALGLPVTVYRPGNIGPHRSANHRNPDDLSTLILQACEELQSAPLGTGWRFEMTPVDVMSDLILSIAELSEPCPRYQLVHPHPIEAEALFSLCESRAWLKAGRAQDWGAWRAQLLSSERGSHKLLASSLPYFNELLTDRVEYSIENIKADLPERSAYYARAIELSELIDKLMIRSQGA